MFIPPLKVGDVISRPELSEIFQVANVGGMLYSSTYNVLVLVSNHHLKITNPRLNPFDDVWEDDVFYYTGQGNKGDQAKTGQNKRLYNQDYDALYLFEVFDQGECTYKGPMKLAGTPLYGEQHKNGIQPDSNGKMRKVWIFPITQIK